MGTHMLRKESGQSLVFLAIMMLVFVGILMLGIDGGMAFAKRRAAQNAADAGALAGARTLCITKDAMAAYNDATTYAETYNEAADSLVSVGSRTVIVTTTIPYSTTFAHFFGFDEVTAQATAEAGCFSPTIADGVLPVAWACRPPVTGWPSNSTRCQQQWITWVQLQAYMALPTPHVCDPGGVEVCPELYIVMDSYSYDNDLWCMQDTPPGVLDCDLDGDGEIDWLTRGGRSWLDLDGKNDADHDCSVTTSEGLPELREWIRDGYDCDLSQHTWVPEDTGNQRDLYEETETRRQTNPLVLIPVFDDYCPDGDPRNASTWPDCQNKWHGNTVIHQPDSIDDIHLDTAQQPQYFHIETFALFYITCVRLNNGDYCVGAERLETLNGNEPSLKSVEGYFITGTVPGLGGRGDPNVDTGVYTFYLTR